MIKDIEYNYELGFVDFVFVIKENKQNHLTDILDANFKSNTDLQFKLLEQTGKVDKDDMTEYIIEVTDKRIPADLINIYFLVLTNLIFWDLNVILLPKPLNVPLVCKYSLNVSSSIQLLRINSEKISVNINFFLV